MSTRHRPPVINADGRGRFWFRLVWLLLGVLFAVAEMRHFVSAIRRHLRRPGR